MTIREPAVAGSFYPADPLKLRSAIARLLEEAKDNSTSIPRIIIAPHAGYIYSGGVAAAAYAVLKRLPNQINRVLLIGPSHFVAFDGLAVPSSDFFATPLGKIPIDREAIKNIASYVIINDEAHKKEHSLEVQLPFLQCILDEFSLIPIAVGNTTPESVSSVIEVLWDANSTIVVISTDLSHYHPYEEARDLDRLSATFILNKDFKRLRGEMACGFRALQGALQLAVKYGLQVTEIARLNSGDTAAGARDKGVVGYGAYHIGNYIPGPGYSDEYKKFLLRLAKQSIYYGIEHHSCMTVTDDDPVKRATFVTLKQNGELRGCIGTLQATRGVASDIVHNAYGAAFHDTRFRPINTPEELSTLSISISVISPMEPINFNSEADLLSQIRPKIDGLVLSDEYYSGTFLPVVWEDIPDKKDFLRHLKSKAGMPQDYWSDTIQCHRYTSSTWGETNTQQ